MSKMSKNITINIPNSNYNYFNTEEEYMRKMEERAEKKRLAEEERAQRERNFQQSLPPLKSSQERIKEILNKRRRAEEEKRLDEQQRIEAEQQRRLAEQQRRLAEQEKNKSNRLDFAYKYQLKTLKINNITNVQKDRIYSILYKFINNRLYELCTINNRPIKLSRDIIQKEISEVLDEIDPNMVIRFYENNNSNEMKKMIYLENIAKDILDELIENKINCGNLKRITKLQY